MLLLPELKVGPSCWRIPLSGDGAAHLAWGLLGSADQRAESFCTESFCTALLNEPGLALWIACRGGEQFSSAATVRDLVHVGRDAVHDAAVVARTDDRPVVVLERPPRERIACLWLGSSQTGRLVREIREFAEGLEPIERPTSEPGPPPTPSLAMQETAGDD